MFILTVSRDRGTHIADYCDSVGNVYSACGKIFLKNEMVNTIMLDGPISCACKKCYSICKNRLWRNPRSVKGNLFFNLQYGYNSDKFDLPEDIHYRLNNHHWDKMMLYKRYANSLKMRKIF